MIRAHFISLIIAASILSFSTVSAQPYIWENYTSKKQITSLQTIDGEIWVTSSGGVARIDLFAGSSRTYINSDGLGSVAATFAKSSGDGNIYFGSSDGYLSELNLGSDVFSISVLQGRDGEALKLTEADTSSGYLWIATDIGVVKFDRFRHGGEVKETYRTLGTFASESDIFDVLVDGNTVYAATGRGIAYADRTNEFLLDPGQWSNIEFDDTVFVLCDYGGQVFAGTGDGLYRVVPSGDPVGYSDLNGWRIVALDASGSELLVLADTTIVTQKLGGASGTAVVSRVYSLSSPTSENFVVRVGENELPTGANSISNSTSLLVGTSDDGVFVQTVEGELEPLSLPGPGSNDLIGGGVTSTGLIYAVSLTTGYSRYQSGIWSDVSLDPFRLKQAALVDSRDNLWVGTYGSGVFRVSPDGEPTRFHRTNSELFGNNDDPPASYDYIVVNSIYEDTYGDIWFSARRGDTNRVAVMFDPNDSLWTYFNKDDGIIADESRAIAAGDGFVAIGDLDQAVTYIDYGQSPLDHQDDVVGIYGTSRRLPSNSVTALTVDLDNTLWVGTNLGLAYFDGDIKFFFPVALPDEVSNDVRALAVDSRNNLWVGTSSGLAFISFGQAEKLAFTTANSLLLSDDIRGLDFDKHTGKLLIFTGGGLSILDYNLDGGTTEATVYPYPNPFVIGQTIEQPLRFKINQRASVMIYNVAGELVRKMSQAELNTGWDGRNDYGNLVASGIYIYQLLSEDQKRYTGKILVLHK
jgi:streptogramin lyase